MSLHRIVGPMQHTRNIQRCFGWANHAVTMKAKLTFIKSIQWKSSFYDATILKLANYYFGHLNKVRACICTLWLVKNVKINAHLQTVHPILLIIKLEFIRFFIHAWRVTVFFDAQMFWKCVASIAVILPLF